MPHTFDAFIFDLDDTLVDSSAVVRRVMGAWCDEHGLAIDEVMSLSKGLRTEDTIAAVAPHLDAKSEALEIESREQRAAGEVEPIRGAREFLQELPKDRWAIATSSSRPSAEAKLMAAGLTTPDVLVAAEMVQNGKPHPEAFLLAAAGLASGPSRCLVFEDADSGIKAATAAGCSVVVIGSEADTSVSGVIGRVDDFTQVGFLAGSGGLAVSLRPNREL